MYVDETVSREMAPVPSTKPINVKTSRFGPAIKKPIRYDL